MFYFYNVLNREKTFEFLTFSGDIEIEHWIKIDYFSAFVVDFE